MLVPYFLQSDKKVRILRKDSRHSGKRSTTQPRLSGRLRRMKLAGPPGSSSTFLHSYSLDFRSMSRRAKLFSLFFTLMFAMFLLYEIRLATQRAIISDAGTQTNEERPKDAPHKPHSSIEDSIHDHPIALFLILFVIVLHVGAIVRSFSQMIMFALFPN